MIDPTSPYNYSDGLCRNHLFLLDKSYVIVLSHRSGERIKICQVCMYYVPCLKKFKDTIVSSQKEQSCLYDVAAYSIAHNKTVRR